jgi:hypothetical protein
MNDEMGAAALFGETIMLRIELVAVKSESELHLDKKVKERAAGRAAVGSGRMSRGGNTPASVDFIIVNIGGRDENFPAARDSSA